MSILEIAIVKIENDLEALENEFEELSAKTIQLELINDDHEIRLNNLDDLVADLKIDLESRMLTINENFSSINIKIGQLEDSDIALNMTIQNLQNGLENLRNHSDFRDDEITKLVDNLQIDIEDLQKELNRVEQESDKHDANLRSEIQEDLTQLSSELKALTANVTQNKLKNDDHEIRLNDLDDHVADLKIDFESRILAINKNLSSINIKIGQLEDAGMALNTTIQSLRNGLENLRNHSDLRDDQLTDLIHDLQIDIDDLQKELNRVEQESEKDDADLQSEIQEGLTQLSSELKALIGKSKC